MVPFAVHFFIGLGVKFDRNNYLCEAVIERCATKQIHITMSKDYSDLRHKTPFDICDDEEVLNRVFQLDVTSKDERIALYKEDVYYLWSAYEFLAEETNDEELMAATHEQFKDEIAAFFNE